MPENEMDGWWMDGGTNGLIPDVVREEYLLQQATELRLILTGGLFTQDIISRHHKAGPTNCSCSIGGKQTLLEIS